MPFKAGPVKRGIVGKQEFIRRIFDHPGKGNYIFPQ